MCRDVQRLGYGRRRCQHLSCVVIEAWHWQKVYVEQEHVLCVGLLQCHVTQIVHWIELLTTHVRTQ